MADVECKIIKDYGTIGSCNGVELKLQEISWNGNPAKLDLRTWRNGYALKGLTITKEELKKLSEIIKGLGLTRTTKNKTLVDICKEVEKKSTVESAVKSADVKKESYKNAYEKFKDQFEEYRNTQPDNRKKGYELTHNLILEHIKDICKTSDEYNKNGLQEWKNTGNMMRFCQDKAFENAEALMNINTREEASELMFQWVDEYIGADDKPKAKSSTKQSDTTKAKRGRPKKG